MAASTSAVPSNADVYTQMTNAFASYDTILANADSSDFTTTELTNGNWFEIVDNARSETNPSTAITNLLSTLPLAVIDRFVQESYFNAYLKNQVGTSETFANSVILTRGIVSETRGFNINSQTKMDLGHVVKNRKDSTSFPNTYLGVLEQSGQFSGWPDEAKTYSQMTTKASKFRWAQSYFKALQVTAGNDTISGAKHFYSPYISDALMGASKDAIKPCRHGVPD